jgi:L-gulonate 3-dehydrogenase
MTHGLAMRWNFMGPFQTIDLNAPQGVQDYCNRYLEGMYAVTATQDSARHITPETVQRVDAAMRSKYSTDQITDATRWRDQRLVDFVKHRAAVEKSTDVMYPHSK